MSYLVLDGFPKGLDVRRFSLAPQPGSLVELSNGHLTNGGEIEKRKAFPLYANVAITETGAELTAGVRTFGMQETGVGLTVFGSAIEYFTATTVTRATAANVATLNIGTHTLRVGDLVTITGIAGYTATNVALISATSPNITYANVHANEGTTADVTGTVVLTTPTLSRPVLASAMPTGVTYQQLQHPAVIDGVTYDNAKHAMTAVTGSCVYGGLIFAVAIFEDDNVFCYYDGALVRDMTDGLVMAHLDTNTKIATAIKEMVNRSSRYTATSSTNTVTITGLVGDVYQIAAQKNNADSADLTALVNNTPTAPASANPATGSFRITGGSAAAGTNKITKVEVQQVIVRQTVSRKRVANVATLDVGASHGITGGMLIDVFGIPGYNVVGATVSSVGATTVLYANAGADENPAVTDATGSVRAGTPITITNGAVDWVTNNSVTASDVAASINAATTSPEYTAIATDNVVTIQAATSEGDTPNGFEVKVTTAGNVCVGDGVFRFIGTGMSILSFNIDGADVMTSAFLEFPATYTTINAFVAAIAADIRTGSATHGYTAFASGPLLSVSRVATSSKDAPLDVFVILAGAGGTGSPIPGSGVTAIDGGIASLPALGVTVKPRKKAASGSFPPGSLSFGYEFEADINGGIAPYTYVWLLVMPSDGSFAKGNLTSEVSFGRTDHFNEPITATVTVTDSLGSVTTSPAVVVYSS